MIALLSSIEFTFAAAITLYGACVNLLRGLGPRWEGLISLTLLGGLNLAPGHVKLRDLVHSFSDHTSKSWLLLAPWGRFTKTGAC
ncbi:hypothetical protein DER45DRAFT_578862 [Fusarium avenaceum]|nr:hypothetical protein DER45DRAFT_578862 [Fusarium avenaceum]